MCKRQEQDKSTLKPRVLRLPSWSVRGTSGAINELIP